MTFSGDEILLKKIHSGKKYFLKAKEVTNGIHTHFDFVNKKIFKKHSWTEIGQGIFGLSENELQNLHLDAKEKELIKPYYSTDEVKRFFTSQPNKQWLIYTDSSFKNKDKMSDFPVLKEHLDRFVEIITSDNKPYGLHRAREEHFFNGEKILSLRMCSSRPSFSYSNFRCYVPAAFYVIQTNSWNMKFLTGLLNSKLIQYWLRHVGKMKGNIYQIDKEPLLGIPLVKPSEDNQKSIADLVFEILQLKAKDINADISSIEQAIDDIVFRLYGFTDSEIAVVDEDLSASTGDNSTYTTQEDIVDDDNIDNDEDDGDF